MTTDPGPQDGCTCPHDIGSYGSLNGISMGRGIVRTSTKAGCPVHDSCARYTAENRAIYGERGAWLYCPIHGTTNCPPRLNNRTFEDGTWQPKPPTG